MMFIVGITGIVVGFILLFYWCARDDYTDRKIGILLLTFVLSVAIMATGLGLGVQDRNLEPARDYNIVSVGLQSGFEGHFILGCGSIKSEPYYYCMKVEGNKTYSLSAIKAKNAVIVEDNSREPSVWTYKMLGTQKQSPWWAVPFSFYCGSDETILIVVPEGTVVQEFLVDVTR